MFFKNKIMYEVSKFVTYNFYYIVFIIIFLFLLFFIGWLFRKYNLMNRVLYATLVPSPIVNLGIAKFLNKFVNYEILNIIFTMKQNLIAKFGDTLHIPCVLIISDDMNISFGVSHGNESFKYYIKDKILLIQIPLEINESVILLMNDVFNGCAFQTICFNFNMEKSYELIGNTLNFIFSITQSVMNVSVAFYLNNEEHSKILRDISDQEILGLDINNRILESEIIFYQWLEKICSISLNYKKNIAILNVTSKIITYKDNIKRQIEILQNSLMNFRGIFLIDCQFDNLLANTAFTSKLFDNVLFSYCNEIQILRNSSSKNSNTLGKYIKNLFFLMVLFFFGWSIYNTWNNFQNMNYVIKAHKEIRNDKKIDTSILVKRLNNIRINNRSFFYNFNDPGVLASFNKLKNFIFNYSYERILHESKDLNNLKFSNSPTETDIFLILENNIKNLCYSFNEMTRFVENIGKDNIVNNRILEQQKTTKAKILQQFQFFLDNLNNYDLIVKINNLNSEIETLFNGDKADIDQITKTLESLYLFKKQMNLAVNDWWIYGDLGKRYENLMSIVNNLTDIGPDLSKEIKLLTENALKYINNLILSSENVFIGRLFTLETSNNIIKNSKIRYSSDLDNFLNLLNSIKYENFFNVVLKENMYTSPQNNQWNLWKIDILDEILEKIKFREKIITKFNQSSILLNNLIIKLIDNALYAHIYNNMHNAQNIISNVISMEIKAKNIQDSNDKINNIKLFVSRSLKKDFSFFVEQLNRNSVMNIVVELNSILEKSIFLSYKKLNTWNGENLINFLFQCDASEINMTINKNIQYLQYLKSNIIIYILPKLLEFNEEYYKLFKYIVDELSAYSNAQKSDIGMFENLILSLNNITLDWKPNNVKINSKDNYFFYHLKMFNSSLINRINALVLEKSVAYYNELVEIFNTRLANRFPFGHNDDCDEIDLIYFLQKYNEYRPHLVKDQQFNKLNLEIGLNILDDLNNFFLVKNNVLYLNTKINYHINDMDSSNMHLIKFYKTTFGDFSILGDNVDYSPKASDSFILNVNMAQTSVMKMKTIKLGQTVLSTKMDYEFVENMGLVRFVNKFLFKIMNKDAFVRIKIPLTNAGESINEYIITYVKVANYPYFFNKLNKIQL
jgi:hypothetical protein